MKSAKEILSAKEQVWIAEDGEMEDEYSYIKWQYALEAMEAYATQFKGREEDIETFLQEYYGSPKPKDSMICEYENLVDLLTSFRKFIASS